MTATPICQGEKKLFGALDQLVTSHETTSNATA